MDSAVHVVTCLEVGMSCCPHPHLASQELLKDMAGFAVCSWTGFPPLFVASTVNQTHDELFFTSYKPTMQLKNSITGEEA